MRSIGRKAIAVTINNLFIFCGSPMNNAQNHEAFTTKEIVTSNLDKIFIIYLLSSTLASLAMFFGLVAHQYLSLIFL